MHVSGTRRGVGYETALAQLLRKAAPDGPPISQAQGMSEAVDSYRSGIVLIKVGGSTFSERRGVAVFDDMKILNHLGIPMVLVHGGGGEIDEEMNRLGIRIERRSGQRVSNSATVSVLRRVMPRIGAAIARSLIEEGIDAEHFWGHHGILRVEKISDDLGYVGRVTEVRTDLISRFAKDGIVPVITPLGFNDGRVYNINADLASGAIAGAIGAKKIVFVTDVDGIFDGKNWRSEITVDEIIALQNAGRISDGMIPKTEAAVSAVRDFKIGASIINGGREDSLLSSLFGFGGSGTEIMNR
jgi:acetylglutamate kinase